MESVSIFACAKGGAVRLSKVAVQVPGEVGIRAVPAGEEPAPTVPYLKGLLQGSFPCPQPPDFPPDFADVSGYQPEKP